MITRNFLLGVAMAIALMILAALAYIWLTPTKDVIDARYPTHASAVEERAFEHGMVPEFLPASARQIISVKNIDLNTVVVEFSYDAREFSSFLSKQKTSRMPAGFERSAPNGSQIDFGTADTLIFIAKVDTPDKYSQGSMIVNTAQQRALFVFRPIRDS